MIFIARVSVLVNGSPTKEFKRYKGLWQGDPLSPFLFITAAGLNVLLKRVVNQGLLKGVVVGDQDFRLTQLQFADDMIIFCEAEERELVMIKKILRCFEVLSFLTINYHKSMVSGVGVQQRYFSKNLRCKHQALLIRYLGMSLVVSPRLKSTWKPVRENFSTKLARWKRRHITFRACLFWR